MFPKIGKLYRLKYYESAAEFFRYIGPDNLGQEIFSAITTGEQVLISQEIMMLVRETTVHVSEENKNLVQWTFLIGENIYHVSPYERTAFQHMFIEATTSGKHTPNWKTLPIQTL